MQIYSIDLKIYQPTRRFQIETVAELGRLSLCVVPFDFKMVRGYM